MMNIKKQLLLLIALLFAGSLMAQNVIYVSSTGKNSNPGTKSQPKKNIEKAIKAAKAGDKICVAAGNYQGTMRKGYVEISKPVELYGGYAPDFSTRDILRYKTTFIPGVEARGTGSKCLFQMVDNMQQGTVVIDGFFFDRCNTNNYNANKGKPKGVETGMMISSTNQVNKPTIGFNVSKNLIVRNCVFNNSTLFAIQCGIQNHGSVKILNNVFTCSVYGAIEIWGKSAGQPANVEVAYNTILFTWTRTSSFEDMGYGIRFRSGASMNIHNNIIGLSCWSGVDGTHMTSMRGSEKFKVDNNIFFLNKKGDMSLPSGGGKFLNIRVADFEDVDQLESATGNSELKDLPALRKVLNKPYLEGFLNVSYKEKTDYDPNSDVNAFRSAMGMNTIGTIHTSVSMFANRYPLNDAIKLFGIIKGQGAQLPR